LENGRNRRGREDGSFCLLTVGMVGVGEFVCAVWREAQEEGDDDDDDSGEERRRTRKRTRRWTYERQDVAEIHVKDVTMLPRIFPCSFPCGLFFSGPHFVASSVIASVIASASARVSADKEVI
jgi:hypothetical protein